jgi:hypothetical protein
MGGGGAHRSRREGILPFLFGWPPSYKEGPPNPFLLSLAIPFSPSLYLSNFRIALRVLGLLLEALPGDADRPPCVAAATPSPENGRVCNLFQVSHGLGGVWVFQKPKSVDWQGVFPFELCNLGVSDFFLGSSVVVVGFLSNPNPAIPNPIDLGAFVVETGNPRFGDFSKQVNIFSQKNSNMNTMTAYFWRLFVIRLLQSYQELALLYLTMQAIANVHFQPYQKLTVSYLRIMDAAIKDVFPISCLCYALS